MTPPRSGGGATATAPVTTIVNGSHSTGASCSTASSSTDPDAAQQVVKNFVRSIVSGVTLQVLCAGATTEFAVVSLDRKLRTMYMQRAGKKDAKKRQIRLEQVIEIAVGSDIRDEVELLVDDHCVTLLLDNYQALSFRFPDVEERDTFALCLSMFVDGRREEVFKENGKDQHQSQ
jgi:hypothetical protein